MCILLAAVNNFPSSQGLAPDFTATVKGACSQSGLLFYSSMLIFSLIWIKAENVPTLYQIGK